jgi:hypothetical protein
MENKIKNIILSLMCISLLVSIGLNIFFYQQMKKSTQDTDQKPVVSNLSVNNKIHASNLGTNLDVKGRESKKNEVDNINYQLDAAEEELDIAHEKLSYELSNKSEFIQSLLEQNKKINEDPSSKQRKRAFWKTVMESEYEKLFKDLNLTQEQKEKLLNITVDKELEYLNICDELGAITNPSEEKREEFRKRFKDYDEEYFIKINELLGGNDYIKYEDYEDERTERYYITGFNRGLSANEQLTEIQQKIIIDSIYEARKNFNSKQGIEKYTISFNSERLTENGIAKNVEIVSKTFEQYITTAKSILTTDQSEQFNAYLKEKLHETEVGMKNAAYIYFNSNLKKQ